MDNTIFLAQYLGILYIVISLATALKPKKVHAMLEGLKRSRSAFFVLGTVVFSLGLLVVMLHNNDWDGFAGIVVGIIGWGAICESMMYFFLPHRSLAGIIGAFESKEVLTASSIIGIGLGIALLITGFNIL